ncbi:MAG: hypothetical protein ACK2UF_14680, partial [Candidatus Promineifilaceae bacterium]
LRTQIGRAQDCVGARRLGSAFCQNQHLRNSSLARLLYNFNAALNSAVSVPTNEFSLALSSCRFSRLP